MKVFFKGFSLGSVLTVISLAAGAAPQWCQGTVSRLTILADGTIFVNSSYRGDYTRICNINTDVGGVTATNCAAWFAILKSAVQRQSQIITYYPEAVSCSSLSTSSLSPLPAYIQQLD